MVSNKYCFLLVLVFCLFFSCEKQNNAEGENGDGFDRSSLLSNWADNIIIPAYDNFYNSLLELDESANSFVAEPSIQLLQNLSEDWLNAYRIWQHIEMFDIGLAEIINYKGKMNIYPTDIDLINNNIISNTYDINNNNNFDARGFPAIDYMLHGLAETKSNIIEVYNSNISYSDYLLALISSMIYNTDLIIQDWTSFRTDFINSTDNTATSAINKMTNDFIYYFEKGLRANKIGIPAGIFSNDPIPSAVEAFYKSDASKELALEALSASRNFFIGQHFNNDMVDLSLDSYLNFLNISSENNLSEIILSQFMDAENQLNQLDNNFINQIEINNLEMLLTYDAVQQLVVSFKVDMLQALSISVDYVDADGD